MNKFSVETAISDCEDWHAKYPVIGDSKSIEREREREREIERERDSKERRDMNRLNARPLDM